MSKILLDYVFPISQILPTPDASTAFLKQVALVCKPKSGQEGNVGELYVCTTMTQVAARTDNTNAQQLFNAGKDRVLILLSDDLDLATYLADYESEFFTLLASSDFDTDDIAGAKATGNVTITSYANLVNAGNDTVEVAGIVFTAGSGVATPGAATFQAATGNNETAASLRAQINAHEEASALVVAGGTGAIVSITAVERGEAGNDLTLAYEDEGTATVGATVSGAELTGGTAPIDVGAFPGVVGLCFLAADSEEATEFAAVENRSSWIASSDRAKNMCYAFGKLLSSLSDWTNQQYITMPFNDGADTLGEANSYFDDKISFVIHDDEFSNRLALFAVGGRAIVAPYILKNLMVDLQSRAVSWISGNQPQYTLKEATLLETRLQEDVINLYITRTWITAGIVLLTLEEDNFVASGNINVSEPKALWRVFSLMQQTL